MLISLLFNSPKSSPIRFGCHSDIKIGLYSLLPVLMKLWHSKWISLMICNVNLNQHNSLVRAGLLSWMLRMLRMWGECVNVWMLISDKRLNQSNFTILLVISGVLTASINTSLQSIANKCGKKNLRNFPV